MYTVKLRNFTEIKKPQLVKVVAFAIFFDREFCNTHLVSGGWRVGGAWRCQRQGRTEIRYNTVSSYALLTLTYRLDIKPKAKTL